MSLNNFYRKTEEAVDLEGGPEPTHAAARGGGRL